MNQSSHYFSSPLGVELLQKIFTEAGQGIIIIDDSGKIQFVNQHAEYIFRYNPDEMNGLLIEDLVPTPYKKGHVAQRDGFIENPVTRPMGIGRHLTGLRKDGSEFPVEVSLSHVRHQNSNLVVGFVTDITKRQEIEDELKDSKQKIAEYANKLESKVFERTQELEHLNMGLKSQIRERKLAEEALKDSLDDLKKAEKEILNALEKEKELNEMKSRFISTASHEFRTPLTTIHSSASLVAKYTETDQQPNREKHVLRIKTAVQNLTNILNDFLSLEKLDSESVAVRIDKFTIQNIIHEVLDLFELTLKKGQQLDVRYDDDLPIINNDPQIIKNIIINLISNAIKYSPEGKTITIRAFFDNHDICVSIKDEGIGIPEDEQKKLFQRFYRAENASNIQGTGLGLNIVKRYLDLIDGNITFTSRENYGSEFTISFPPNT